MKTITLEIDDNDLIVNKGLDALELLLPILKTSITVEKRKNRKGATGITRVKKTPFNAKAELMKLVDNEQIVDDYLTVRKEKRGVFTKTVLESLLRDCQNYNIDLLTIMRICILKNWRGFEYDWLKPEDFIKFGIKKVTKAKAAAAKAQPQQQAKLSEKELYENEMKVRDEINDIFEKFKTSGLLPLTSAWVFDALVDRKKIHMTGNKEITDYFDLKREEARQQLETRKKGNTQTIGSLLSTILVDKVDIEVKMKKIVLREFFEKKQLLKIEKIFETKKI